MKSCWSLFFFWKLLRSGLMRTPNIYDFILGFQHQHLEPHTSLEPPFSPNCWSFVSAQSPNVDFSDSTRTQRCSHPTWMQHKLLRWSMATEEQQPTAEPVHLTHTLSQTHTFRLYTLSVNRAGIHWGGITVNDSRWEISLSRWPTGRQSTGRKQLHISARWQQTRPAPRTTENGCIFEPTRW